MLDNTASVTAISMNKEILMYRSTRNWPWKMSMGVAVIELMHCRLKQLFSTKDRRYRIMPRCSLVSTIDEV